MVNLDTLRRLTPEGLDAMIETCKDELINNCQMPSEYCSGDFLAGKNYALKEIIYKCNKKKEEF